MHGMIAVVQTGGTVDKNYLATDAHHGYNFEIGVSAWHSIWSRAGSPFPIRFVSLCKKDSLDMTDDDRLVIRNGIESLTEERVVILHGTDTIRETAEFLSTLTNKTIVLTGAMTPERFRESDADFNVGMAIGAAQCLPAGVYIALYGEVVQWRDHQKVQMVPV